MNVWGIMVEGIDINKYAFNNKYRSHIFLIYFCKVKLKN
jgi:hypothetical protein